MPKLEDKTTYFTLDEAGSPKNTARVIIKDDNIGLREIAGPELVNPIIFSDWTDLTDSAYASKAALLTALGTIIFK